MEQHWLIHWFISGYHFIRKRSHEQQLTLPAPLHLNGVSNILIEESKKSPTLFIVSPFPPGIPHNTVSFIIHAQKTTTRPSCVGRSSSPPSPCHSPGDAKVEEDIDIGDPRSKIIGLIHHIVAARDLRITLSIQIPPTPTATANREQTCNNQQNSLTVEQGGEGATGRRE